MITELYDGDKARHERCAELAQRDMKDKGKLRSRGEETALTKTCGGSGHVAKQQDTCSPH